MVARTRGYQRPMSSLKKLLIASIGALISAAAPAVASGAPVAPPGFGVSTFAGAPTTEPATVGADDITSLDGNVFVGWQNGVGTKGEPNPSSGQTSSTLVEYDGSGHQVQMWSLAGKLDGLGADSSRGVVVATVNEDGNSSLYTVAPNGETGAQVAHYAYSPEPDSSTAGGVFTGGGTDAVVVHGGHIFLAASNPGTHAATALFLVHLHPGSRIAALTPTFADDATASDALTGEPVELSLEDPDSNAYVPSASPRFAGQIAVDGQADKQLVLARHLPAHGAQLTRLALTFGGMPAGVDDVRWTTGSTGSLLVVDSKAGVIYRVDGAFAPGTAFASLDTVGEEERNSEVEVVDLFTGEMTPFLTGLEKAKGLLWLASEGREKSDAH